MFANVKSTLKTKYALTDTGVKSVAQGTAWTAVANLIIMCGMCALYFAMEGIVGALVGAGELPDIVPFACGLAAFIAALFVANWFQYVYTYGVFYAESGRQRITLAEHLRRLPLSFFGRRDVADLTETVLGDVATMEHAYSHVLGELFGAVISTSVVFVGMLFFNWQLALASFWSVPVAFALLFATRPLLEPLMRSTRAAGVATSEKIQETLDCVREIRATNQEVHYLEGLNAKIDEAEARMVHGELANGLIVNVSFVVLRLGIPTTLLVGGMLVAAGQADFMIMFAFLLVVSRIYAPFDQCLMLVSELFLAGTAAERMHGIMNEPIATGATEFAPVGHDVVFENVSFGYGDSSTAPLAQSAEGASPTRHPERSAEGASPTRHPGRSAEGAKSKDLQARGSLSQAEVSPAIASARSVQQGSQESNVLSNVSFTVKEGEVTALVGPSGSGKSTCSRLAARFWDATSGTVRVGGVDVSTVDPEVLLRDYAVVFQDVLLFDDTVMGNIRLGRRDATDEEVLAAARAANCDEFVSRMPEGYQTMIGENGSRLSGGERQRISIARALLKNAPIVLLDEATASLDVENETQVQAALSRLLVGKTVIVIAHRMRTVQGADKIVVLREGRVVEQGAPAELLAQGGEFAHMVALQQQSAAWTL